MEESKEGWWKAGGGKRRQKQQKKSRMERKEMKVGGKVVEGERVGGGLPTLQTAWCIAWGKWSEVLAPPTCTPTTNFSPSSSHTLLCFPGEPDSTAGLIKPREAERQKKDGGGKRGLCFLLKLCRTEKTNGPMPLKGEAVKGFVTTESVEYRQLQLICAPVMKGSSFDIKTRSCDYSAQRRLLRAQHIQPPSYSLRVMDDIKAAPQTLPLKTLAGSSSIHLL
ncbi:unnamed protein product [Pleuronectes platessa]|uniref:Uncharacterized protein n=1 Tax=Pleuronectes platessa TaxID=8262 RepID=A0A9N7YBP4_PLEPL|nr:unnamed protein product [Pleuronectes platessa]